jgi:hypothetical protein
VTVASGVSSVECRDVEHGKRTVPVDTYTPFPSAPAAAKISAADVMPRFFNGWARASQRKQQKTLYNHIRSE